MQAPADGKIVAWTITLGTPGPRQIRFFNQNYGGASQAGISVLKTGTRLFGRVTGRSAIQSLQPYFGTTVQFPLGRALNVRKGYLVALTVPSWAPALALGMGNDTSWRASRARNGCQEPGIQSAQLDLARPRAVPLPLSHGAADLHRDADHEAEAAEAAEARDALTGEAPQQAPAFSWQNCSNFCGGEPAVAGAWVEAGLSCVAGAGVAVAPVFVPVPPVEPVVPAPAGVGVACRPRRTGSVSGWPTRRRRPRPSDAAR